MKGYSMKSDIDCKICGKSFNRITYGHLSKHGMTMTEYREKFNCDVVSELGLFNMRSRLCKHKPKEVLDDTNSITCLICGSRHKALNLHITKMHNIKPAEYLQQFPSAQLYSQHVKDKMSEKSYMKKQKGKSLEERLGTENAALIKSKIGEKASIRQLGTKRSDEYKNKMKETWNERREEWSTAIKTSANRPEVRDNISKSQKLRIERDGYHLARGKESYLEKGIRQILENNGYTVIKQKGTKKKTLGTVRFFDMFVPELNLIIEADGEYWHSNRERIRIDQEKTNAAIQEGYEFLRISDVDFSKNNMSEEKLLKLLSLSKSEKLKHSSEIIRLKLFIFS